MRSPSRLGLTRTLVLLGAASLIGLFTACGDDDPPRNVAPEMGLVTCPTGDMPLGSACVFTWWATDEDGEIAGFYYGLDAATPNTWITASACTLETVPLGAHTFHVQAKDDAGDLSPVVSCEFTVIELSVECAVAPDNLDFGSVALGSSVDKTFTLTNSGTAVLAGTVAETCDQYEITSGAGAYSLAPGEVHTATVRFAPTVAGTQACTIDFGADACADLPCTGIATDVVACTVSPASLSFGSISAGATQDLTVTLTNNGTAVLAGTIAETCPEFSITAGGGAYSLQPGQSQAVTVRFAPTAAGTQSCTIDFGADACADVPCTGIATDVVACAVSPASLSFGSIDVGATQDLTVTLTNNGTTVLAGTIAETCPEFSITAGGGAYSLQPGQSQAVTVRFAPTTAGAQSCTIDFGADACADVPCTGTATDVIACSVAPSSLTFGTVDVGSGTEQTFTLTNNGTGTLAGSVAETCDHYSITAGSGAYSLQPGAAHSVTVRYAPTTAGTHDCTIDLGPDACADVPCTGAATDVVACEVTPTSLSFGDVNIGSLLDLPIIITNKGSTTLSGVVTGVCDSYFLVQGGGAYTLAPGEARVVVVRFIPLIAATFACSIDLGDAACAPVVCTGTGVAESAQEFNANVKFPHQWGMLLLNIVGDTFTFELPSMMPPIEVDDVIIGVRSDLTTYMRKVVSVVMAGNQVILETVQASLVDIYSELEEADEIPLPIEIPGSGGSLGSGVRIANGGLEWDGITVDIPNLGYVRVEDAYVRIDNLVLDTGNRISGGSLVELHNLIRADISFGCDLSAGLDLSAAGADAAGAYTAPEVKIYQNTKSYQSRECLDLGECAIPDSAACHAFYFANHIGEPCPYTDAAKCAAWSDYLCKDVCHEVTYTVYLGGVYSWSLAGMDRSGGRPGASPAATINLSNLNGGITVETGERYLNGVWDSIRDVAEIPNVGNPLMPSYSVIDMKPYVVVEIQETVQPCDKSLPAATLPKTRITYYIRSTSTLGGSLLDPKWCLDVESGRDIQIIDATIPPAWVNWLGDNIYQNWNPPLVNPANWPTYHNCWSLF